MAFKRFATTGNKPSAGSTAATSGIVILYNPSSGPTRAAIYEWDFATAAAAAPVDQNYQLALTRTTAAATWTSETPAPLDTADAAAIMLGGQNSTALTASTVLMTIGVNARAGFRWVAIPDSELIIPATANYGICMQYLAVSGGTDSNTGVLFHQE